MEYSMIPFNKYKIKINKNIYENVQVIQNTRPLHHKPLSQYLRRPSK